MPLPKKLDNFEDTVRSGYYREVRNYIWQMGKGNMKSEVEDTWYQDFHQFLLDSGVPEKYVSKVAAYAYEHGHSSGEEEILNYAYGLIDIFK